MDGGQCWWVSRPIVAVEAGFLAFSLVHCWVNLGSIHDCDVCHCNDLQVHPAFIEQFQVVWLVVCPEEEEHKLFVTLTAER